VEEMINIPKQLWYVVSPSHAENLAYMTYYEDNAAFHKRKTTGMDWAKLDSRVWNTETKKYDHFDVKGGVVIDNTPVTDVYIGSSVSRWSTSNKLFRVQDPRGFTVEVPTDNIATLLHLTTVVNGVINEPCVWGREGSNHILLPINSEPYLETLDKMDTLANKLIKLSDIKVGDVVKFFENDTEYTYLGKAKTTWRLKPYDLKYGRGSRYFHRESEKKYLEERLIIDVKWEPVFSHRYKYDADEIRYYKTSNNPKITEVVRVEKDIEVLRKGCSWYSPQRIQNQETNYCDFSIESVEWK
jgi:hypothetical protein